MLSDTTCRHFRVSRIEETEWESGSDVPIGRRTWLECDKCGIHVAERHEDPESLKKQEDVKDSCQNIGKEENNEGNTEQG